MIQFLRALAFVLLVIVALVDYKYVSFLTRKETLFVLSIFTLAVLLFIDAITGFILALSMITIILKMYYTKIPLVSKEKVDEEVNEFITDKHIENAQSNVVIDEHNEKEYKGIEGVYGEEVYGAQGLEILPGYSTVLSSLE